MKKECLENPKLIGYIEGNRSRENMSNLFNKFEWIDGRTRLVKFT